MSRLDERIQREQDEARARITEQQQRSVYEQGREDFAPYREFGENALKDLNALSADPSLVTKLPGYQFRLGEGINTVQNNAAARGGLLSGNALRGVTQFGQDYATGEYDKEFEKRFRKTGVGLTAAGGSADMSKAWMNALSSMYANRPQQQEGDNPFGQLLRFGAGAAGAAGGLGWRPFAPAGYGFGGAAGANAGSNAGFG